MSLTVFAPNRYLQRPRLIYDAHQGAYRHNPRPLHPQTKNAEEMQRKKVGDKRSIS